MKVKKLCIDICSGLGGFSQAFKEDPTWEVVTVDIEKKFRPSIVADVRFLPFRSLIRPEMMFMSPPCERFSKGNRMFPKKGIRAALEIVGACLEAVVDLRPVSWVLENPKARLRWFLGRGTAEINLSDWGREDLKPTELWGRFVLPMTESSRKHTSWGFYHIRDPAVRAKMPMPLSRAFKEGIEYELSREEIVRN